MRSKTILTLLPLFGLLTGYAQKSSIDKAGPAAGTGVATIGEPSATWKEHWFEHDQLLKLKFQDSSVALYYDKDVNQGIIWPEDYLTQAWNYTKRVYGGFGSDGHLYAIFHANKYGGGHPSVYFDGSHDRRNVIDVGLPGADSWVKGEGNELDIVTHEIGHIVEGASKGVHNSPAFPIWHDSKWMEIYQYDLYLGLGRKEDAQRWYDMMMKHADNFPQPGTHWFRDWFYPVYSDYGKTAVLNNFFTLLAKYFPTREITEGGMTYREYTRDLNFGEFIHFWSGAAGVDLKTLALKAFGTKDESGQDWTVQLEKAKIDFPDIKYAAAPSGGAGK